MRTALVLMNAIKYSAMKKILLLLLFSISMAHPAFPAIKELEDLDKLIENKNQYDQLKRQRISSAKKKLAQASDAETRFNLLMEIGNEYTLFKADSAVLYFDRAINEARRGNNEKNILRAQLKKIRPEIIAGYYAEARSEFRIIKDNEIPPELLADFYECGYRLYSFPLNTLERQGDFYGKYLDQASEYRKKWIAAMPEDSDMRRLYEAEQFLKNGNVKSAKNILADLIAHSLKANTGEYAMATALQAEALEMEGNMQESIRYYAISAMTDIRCAIKENQSMYKLSLILYNRHDIDRAYRYIFSSIEDAAFCNSQMRAYNAAAMLPVIESAQRQKRLYHERILEASIAVCGLLLVVLVASVVILAKQKKRLSTARAKLKEANVTKDEYMGQFLELCSIYMKKLDSFTKLVYRKATLGQVDDLIKMMKTPKFSDEQHGRFYQEFDNAFLKIYPTFVTEFNALLRPDEQISTSPNALSTELRIYALMRLGITESTKIAEFLRYSVNTIYAYRNKMRNKAINRENFESDVLKIGHIE